MKNVKRVIIGLFIIFFFFSFFSPNATSATTIGDTTFPADVGKTYTWAYTYPAEAKGVKITFKSESIEQVGDLLIVNCTMRGYVPGMGWQTIVDNELYLAANNTQNYLFFDDIFIPFVIPTPIDLTLVAEAMEADNYSIVGNTIIENYWGDTEEYTFNTNGFLTKLENKYEGELETRLALSTGGDAAIPFGNFFLVFAVISIIALVYFKKQKIN